VASASRWIESSKSRGGVCGGSLLSWKTLGSILLLDYRRSRAAAATLTPSFLPSFLLSLSLSLSLLSLRDISLYPSSGNGGREGGVPFFAKVGIQRRRVRTRGVDNAQSATARAIDRTGWHQIVLFDCT